MVWVGIALAVLVAAIGGGIVAALLVLRRPRLPKWTNPEPEPYDNAKAWAEFDATHRAKFEAAWREREGL